MACIGVIGIHAGSQHFRDMPLDSSVWAVSNFYHGINRFAVASFIMISGCLYLDSKRTWNLRRLWKKKYSADSCSIYFLADVLRSIQDYYKWNAGEGQQSSPGQIYGIYQ